MNDKSTYKLIESIDKIKDPNKGKEKFIEKDDVKELFDLVVEYIMNTGLEKVSNINIYNFAYTHLSQKIWPK
jgi:nucleoid DNA-binding protein